MGQALKPAFNNILRESERNRPFLAKEDFIAISQPASKACAFSDGSLISREMISMSHVSNTRSLSCQHPLLLEQYPLKTRVLPPLSGGKWIIKPRYPRGGGCGAISCAT